MADSSSPPKHPSNYARSPPNPSPILSPLISQALAWKTSSPALGQRRGMYAGRRGSVTFEDLSPPSSPKTSPKSRPSISLPVVVHEDIALSPRKAINMPKCLSAENIEIPRFRRGSASEALQKQLLKVFKREDTDTHEQDEHSSSPTTTTTSTTSATTTAMNSQPTTPIGPFTKLRPLIRLDSFGPDKPPIEEPAHVRKLRDDAQQGVADLIKARKLHALESMTSFYMRDSKQGKYVKTLMQLSKNHLILQFGDSETVIGDGSSDVYFPLKMQVSNISLVEDRTPKEVTKETSKEHAPVQEPTPSGYHIWFFDKVHRGEYDLITSHDYDFVAWLEGLKALVGNSVEVTDGPTVKMLSDLEVDMRMYHLEISEANQHLPAPTPPTSPIPRTLKPPSETISVNKKQGEAKADEEGWELWRKCYAELPDGEDCFNFATYQHPLFIS